MVKETQLVAEGIDPDMCSFTVTPYVESYYVAMDEEPEVLFGAPASFESNFRDDAVGEIEASFDENAYRPAERDALARIVADAKAAIASAANADGVASVVAAAKAAIGKLKTDAEMAREEDDCRARALDARLAAAKSAKTRVKAKTLKKGRARVQWKKAATAFTAGGKRLSQPATGYQVYRSTKKAKGFKKVKMLSGTGKVKFTDKKLKKGKRYYYKVRPYTKIGGKAVYGAWSNVAKVKAR